MPSFTIIVPEHVRGGQRMANKVIILILVSSALVVLFIIASVLPQWRNLSSVAATQWTSQQLKSAKCSLEFKPGILPAASDTDAVLEDFPVFLRDSLAAVRSAPEPPRRQAQLK
jgi:hypothetical protein